MTTPKHNDKPSTQKGETPQQQQHAGRDEREANRQNGNPGNAGQKDGAPGGASSRRGLEQAPERSGGDQVDLKPGSADAGVHGGSQSADLAQGSQRQKQDVQGGSGNRQDGSEDAPRRPFDDPAC
jgi:hypothetical protein